MVGKYISSLSVHTILSFLVFCLEGKIRGGGGGRNDVQRFGETIVYDLSVFGFVLALNNNQTQYDCMIFS